MKFGFMVPRESDFADDRDPYGRIYEYCQMAENLGFDFATFTHHRFSPERPHLSAPFVIMSAVAARTSRLKLVTTIFVLPLYHPLDIAESVAALDQLSGGRVVFGVGTGYREYEAAAVGVPFNKRVSRMSESIAVLREAWTQPAVNFHGQHFNIDNVTVVPKPVQQPHPPIWIGALEENRSTGRAASLTAGSRRTYRPSTPWCRGPFVTETPPVPLAGHRQSAWNTTARYRRMMLRHGMRGWRATCRSPTTTGATVHRCPIGPTSMHRASPTLGRAGR